MPNLAHPARLAVTLGDPAGIGPEVILKALADRPPASRQHLVIVGPRSLLYRTYDSLRAVVPGVALADPDTLEMMDIPHPQSAQIVLGQASAVSGAISFATLQAAIALALEGTVQGIVTGPIAKSAWKAAGHLYPGQTELLAEMADVERFGMLFVARSPHTGCVLRTLLATTHIPLRTVADTLTPELMTRKLGLLVDCLHRDFGLATPTIAVAGLNPHSGEQGQLGREEVEWLGPWLRATGDRFPTVTLVGPVPPDTLWVSPGQAWYGLGDRPAMADAYLALYHDQGLIPVKLMAFDRAVNTSIGLPFVRTSPDHGTAFDIAGQGVANPSSMAAAVQLAEDLCLQRWGLPQLAPLQSGLQPVDSERSGLPHPASQAERFGPVDSVPVDSVLADLAIPSTPSL
jgi:4-hydroxythreonine-4-phosphate dehydrogenase